MNASQQTAARPGLAPALAFAAGLLFAVGLALAGMTQPGKVIAFLDVAGDWDPSLALVMGGAIAVYFTANRLVKRRSAPLACGEFQLPTRREIDIKLIVGEGVFGVGWGLAGYCPGPGITSLGSGTLSAVVFVATMALGMLLHDAGSRMFTGARPSPSGAPSAQWGGSYRDIAPAELERFGDAPRVDVRELEEYEGELGRIPGASLVPLASLERAALGWDRTKPVVVICRSGRRSARAAEQLAKLGFTQVFNLRGGMRDYRTAKLPLECGPATA